MNINIISGVTNITRAYLKFSKSLGPIMMSVMITL